MNLEQIKRRSQKRKEVYLNDLGHQLKDSPISTQDAIDMISTAPQDVEDVIAVGEYRRGIRPYTQLTTRQQEIDRLNP